MSEPREYTCVVADDEALIRRRVAELATSEGIEVVGSAASGREALSLIESLRTPDIAFLDIRMPELSGLRGDGTAGGTRQASGSRPCDRL